LGKRISSQFCEAGFFFPANDQFYVGTLKTLSSKINLSRKKYSVDEETNLIQKKKTGDLGVLRLFRLDSIIPIILKTTFNSL